MAEDCPDFVDWREQFISQERGSRLVHFYLEDSAGHSYLAVVGTERSVRHMLYVASEEFCRSYVSEMADVSGLKWRSRREAVDWLTSFLPRRLFPRDYSMLTESPKYEPANALGTDMAVDGLNYIELNGHADIGRSLKVHNSDIIWSGVSWTCGKQLRHYQAFGRNGTTIATHSFVLVLSEEENRYLAYLEDMYEDKKGQKKVKVRWFHQNKEFACTIPPPRPHPSEVFITPYSQVISAECVDDVATVLTPDHYEKCLALLPYSSSTGIRLCFRQYSKNRFKLFDLSTLRGYFNQAVLSYLDICSVSGEEDEICHGTTIKRSGLKRLKFGKGHQRFLTNHLGIKILGHRNVLNAKPSYEKLRSDLTARRPLSVKFIGPRNSFKPPFKIDEKIELLCQDSGIRGCWFKCTVLQLSHKKLKVRYDDVQNEDNCGNLEEWIPAFRPAALDKLGMRCSGRFTIRPCPPCDYLPENVSLQIGTPVDTWWNDGWWEGVLIGVDSCGDNSLQVYFPGEDIFLVCQRKNLRISKDWVGKRWVNIDAKLDILSAISLISSGEKLTAFSILAKGAESGSSAMSDREAIATQANSNEEDKPAEAGLNRSDEQMENTEQLTPRKRHRDEDIEGICGGEGDIDGDNS